MKHFYNIERTENACVAFGEFDGVHRGHLALTECLVKEARKQNMQSVIVSFKKEDEKAVLTTEEEKEYFLKDTGLDVLVSYECAEGQDLKTFVKEVLAEQLGAKVIVVGKDKDIPAIEDAAGACGMEVVVCGLEEEGGEVITTAAVYQAFEDCDFEKMTKLCGHPYVMIGVVEHGKALGRTVGMPTANLGVADTKLKPPSGVYATLTDVDGTNYKGLTNIGKRPSVDNSDHITIETFLLDFSQSIYGKKLVLEIHLFIRGVVKFDNLEEVQNQVQKDLEKTRTFLDEIMK